MCVWREREGGGHGCGYGYGDVGQLHCNAAEPPSNPQRLPRPPCCLAQPGPALAAVLSLRSRQGSFANDDVEALLLLDDVAYKTAFSSGPLAEALELHDAALEFTTLSRGRYDRRPAAFGRATQEQHFMIDPAWTFLNHGAFGAPLRVAYDSAAWWRDRVRQL